MILDFARLRQSARALALPVLASLISIVINLQYFNLGFDLHHDGLFVTKAIGIREGLSIHSDVFSMYGPLTTWVQASLLSLFPSVGEGLLLKFWGLATIAAISFLVADLGRVAPENFRITQPQTFAASLTWTLTSPELFNRYLLPWPTLLAALLLVTLLYLHALGKTRHQRGNRTQAAVLFFASGLMLGFLPFVRISLGAYSVLTFLMITAVGLALRIPIFRSVAIFSSAGAALAASVVLLALALQGSLLDFFDQSVIGALVWAEVNLDYWQPARKIAGIFVFMLQRELGVGLLAAAILWSITAAKTSQSSRLFPRRQQLRVAIILAFLSVTVATSSSLGSLVRVLQFPSAENLSESFVSYLTPNDRLAYLVMFTALLITLLQILKFLRKENRDRFRDLWDSDSILVAASLIGYSQVLPTWDVLHAWWGGALGAVLVFRSISPFFTVYGGRALAGVLVSLYFALSLLLQISQIDQIKQRLTIAPMGTTAEGLLLEPGQLAEILEIRTILDLAEARGGDIDFVVHDGGVASLSGLYLDDDNWFVNWGFLESQRAPIAASLLIVDQQLQFESGETEIETWAARLNYEIQECGTRYCLLSKRE